ncbi:hypothetical protein WICPIJ_005474 [Wickerhamomyces pijperi]|uniref:Nuclear protein STH1/NPS1 n=1 Tax=Wickerhamomyces pijperi TaxID=599730 RepID=A0A9P8Q5P2_WICPI|nr:hypothetical protein WICPIJ_005474 [Wickerhamomyces pijperi]
MSSQQQQPKQTPPVNGNPPYKAPAPAAYHPSANGKANGTQQGSSSSPFPPQQQYPALVGPPQLSPPPPQPIPFPRTRQDLEILLLKYRSLHAINPDGTEIVEIEKVLHKVSKKQELFKQRQEKLRQSLKSRKSTSSTPLYNKEMLNDQLIAIQLLSKNLNLPEELQHKLNIHKTQAIQSRYHLKPVESSLDFNERFNNLGLRDQFSVSTGTTTTVPSDFNEKLGDVLTEEKVTRRINERIDDLATLPANLGTYKADELHMDSPDDLDQHIDDLKIKALVELKALRLLPQQKALKKNLVFNIGTKAHVAVDYLNEHPVVQTAVRSLQVRPKIIIKQTAQLAEDLERQQRLERERIEKALHLEKVNRITEGCTKILMERENAVLRKVHLGKNLLNYHVQIEKEEARKVERTAKQRLQALKANDEEAYLKLLDQTKDTRITHLLRQTNSFLDSLAQAVQNQQNAAKQADGILIEEAITDEQREKIDYFEVAHRVKEQITEQASILVGGKLKEYQLKGLEWMVSLYNNHLNGILADEMGLGKTIQSISLITYLVEKKKQPGPYLVIVPLSTITNWTLEFEKWAPSLKVVVYKGTPNQRKALSYDVRSGNFNVVLTTFEYIIKDRPLLAKHHWVHMIIDEGHRMKNANSKLSATIAQYYKTKNRLILTGTPLQNNLPELWALLNFVLPKVFNSVKTFDEWFNTPFANTGGQEKMELSEEETLLVIRRLHKVLRPFLLRRLKKEVEKDLPDKVEKVVKCKLSGLQYVLYQQMLKHNALFVGAGTSGATKTGIKGLNNKIMQLRKICNHPFVFEEVENIVNPQSVSNDNLWRSAGKFELLDRVLPKFKATGHRVLMFFQMTQVMDIMEDFLQHRGLKYMRLDGSTKADDRQVMLKDFNRPDSEIFCFLLSTRAGGLGLNLQTADTVIIFDSDWNPHQDLQAQDRAHRIGQKNEVRILRLITSDTVEEVILERALQKLDIDGKVIQAGKFDNKSTSEEQEAFLKNLLENEGSRNQNENQELDDEELNDILARNDDEREFFRQMDLERLTNEKMEGLTDRLMTEQELPEVFTEDIEAHLEEKTVDLGRTREKKRVFYDDGLTEEQWLTAMDDDEDTVEAAIERKRAARARRKTKNSDSLEDNGDPVQEIDDESFEINDPVAEGDDFIEEEEPKTIKKSTPKKKRGRPKAKSDFIEDEDDDQAEAAYEQPAAKKSKKETPAFVSKALDLLKEMENKTSSKEPEDSSYYLAEYFIDLPNRKEYPDYYQLIAQPMAISTIRKQLKSNKVKDFKKFRDLVDQIYANAKFYNEEGSYVYNCAVELQEFTDLRFEEIEDQLALE